MERIDPAILHAFSSTSVRTEKISEGLIHSTYKLFTDAKTLLLQKVNEDVFSDVVALQNNYSIIRNELRMRESFRLPAIVYTASGENYFRLKNEVWRCFEYYDNTYSPQEIKDSAQAETLAASFGKYAMYLHGLNAFQLSETLPGFHDLALRQKHFEQAYNNPRIELSKETTRLLTQVTSAKLPLQLFHLFQKQPQAFPKHILHHDCKISNILFSSADDKVICPIDIDTTMPGFFFSDLGDMLRTLAADKKEDDVKFAEMELREEYIRAVNETYTDQVHTIFSSVEIDLLPYSGHLLSFMQCIRFLTDHLNGNIYYRTEYPEQNLVRASNQWQLYTLLNRHKPLSGVNF